MTLLPALRSRLIEFVGVVLDLLVALGSGIERDLRAAGEGT